MQLAQIKGIHVWDIMAVLQAEFLTNPCIVVNNRIRVPV